MPQCQADKTGMAVSAIFKAEAVEARAHAESQYYSLLNPYLNDIQKGIVEVWFQLPGLVFFYAFVAASLVKVGLPLKPAFVAIYASLAAGVLVTRVGYTGLMRLLPVVSIVQNTPVILAATVITGATGIAQWGSAIGAFLVTVSPLSPGGMYASAWAEGLHPRMINKYGAAKEIFRMTYPFEKYLDQSEPSKVFANNLVVGGRVLAALKVILLVIATIKWGATG